MLLENRNRERQRAEVIERQHEEARRPVGAQAARGLEGFRTAVRSVSVTVFPTSSFLLKALRIGADSRFRGPAKQ